MYNLYQTKPLENQNIPKELQELYKEARSIIILSPRGAGAILRLLIQLLCIHLGETGKDLNEDITSLVYRGLPTDIQKALDNFNVIGKNAITPGQIDMNDNIPKVFRLFTMVNIISDIAYKQKTPNSQEFSFKAKIKPDSKPEIITEIPQESKPSASYETLMMSGSKKIKLKKEPEE